MKNYKIKTSFVSPEGPGKHNWYHDFFIRMIHDFSVWLRTGSNSVDINRFRSRAGKWVTKWKVISFIFRLGPFTDDSYEPQRFDSHKYKGDHFLDYVRNQQPLIYCFGCAYCVRNVEKLCFGRCFIKKGRKRLQFVDKQAAVAADKRNFWFTNFRLYYD